MNDEKFNVIVHGFTVHKVQGGDTVLFHEPMGVKYWGMGKMWIHGLNQIYGKISDILTMMGLLLDSLGPQAVQIFIKELAWFVEHAPERIAKKMIEAEAEAEAKTKK